MTLTTIHRRRSAATTREAEPIGQLRDVIHVGRLRVARVLHAFIEREAVTDSGISPDAFWSGLATLLREFGSRNRELLRRRDELQRKIDEQKLTGEDKAEFLKESTPSEYPVPAFGGHDLEPPANPGVFHPPVPEGQ